MADESVRYVTAHMQYLSNLEEIISKRKDICARFLSGERIPITEKPAFVYLKAEPKSKISAIIFQTDAEITAIDKKVASDRLHSRLLKLIRSVESVSPSLVTVDFESSTLTEIAIVLNENHGFLQKNVNGSLKSHLEFAKSVHLLKSKFFANKQSMRASGITSYKQFVKANLRFGERYANKLVALSKLVQRYPQLKFLRISFNEMIKLYPQLLKMTSGHKTFWRRKTRKLN
jgi:hypothetical protein